MNDPILDAALHNLVGTTDDIKAADRLLKVLAEAGEDVTQEKASISQFKARRDKMRLSLRNNGAQD